MRPFLNEFVFSRTRAYRLARHAAFWLCYFAVFEIMDVVDPGFLCVEVALSYLPFTMLFVYFVLYRLVPHLLMRSRYLSFFLWYCAWVLACMTLERFWGRGVVYRNWFIAHPEPKLRFWNLVGQILDPTNFTVANIMAVFAVAIAMFKFWRVEVWQKLQVRQEKAAAELGLLKAKLQPQFMFNTLHNLHRLVVSESDSAPQVLMRLSTVLSYVLYEGRAAEVPLERELSICKEYIELERQRFGDELDVSVDFSGDIAGKMIAPMLLPPFIEHAFRQGMREQTAKAWMSVELSVQRNQLFFRVIHSEDAFPIQSGPDTPGLDSTIRRLQLLYPGTHQLSQDKGEGVGILSLTIDLTPPVPLPSKNEKTAYAYV